MKCKLYIIIISVLLMASCNNKTTFDNNNNNNKEKHISNNSLQFEGIPDSLSLNTIYTRRVKYKSLLDTISLSEKDKRFVILYLTTDMGVFKTIDDIKAVNYNAFTYDDDSLISINFQFKEKGINQLNFIIEDMVILNNYSEDGKARVITENTHFQKKLFIR